MNTPIVDYVRDYVNQNSLRLHMPGHKGKDSFGFEKYDITEIDGADVLYSPNGIIKQSEENAAELFGSKKTVYSAEGSSLCIRAMLYLTKIYAKLNNKAPIILSGRNAHKTFVTALSLNDLEVEWLSSEEAYSLISCNITAQLLEERLASLEIKPAAVYVTSPDYLGNTLDIAAISAVCRKNDMLLLVDNAHGAYLKFLPQSCHPLDSGADICCDSAHKTLPVITGGAYLHIGKAAPDIFCTLADNAMSLFSSTSPSYLILQSLDMANKYIAQGYSSRLAEFLTEVDALKKELKDYGYQLFGNEPLKITIAPKSFGYTGIQLGDILAQKGIICEFSDPDFMVVMLTCENGTVGLEKLKKALLSVEKREPIIKFPPFISSGKRRMSVKEAIFSVCEEIEVEKAVGRVSGNATVACPPAIPIVICGEEIDSAAVEAFKYYGINKCFVVKR